MKAISNPRKKHAGSAEPFRVTPPEAEVLFHNNLRKRIKTYKAFAAERKKPRPLKSDVRPL
jgi:hypothetical protein